MTICTGQEKKEAVIMHGVYSIVANYWTKFLALYGVPTFGIVRRTADFYLFLPQFLA
jgi:hypothetical protein